MSIFMTGGGGAPMMGNFLFLGLMVLVFYFFIIRPQQKRAKEHKQLLANLTKGDRVVTSGGLLGTVVGLKENIAVLRIDESTKVEVLRENIAGKVDS